MEEIIKQIFSNQLIIMACLWEEHKKNIELTKCLEYESQKTSDLFKRHKIDKSFANSIYGITYNNYIKKEDLKKIFRRTKR